MMTCASPKSACAWPGMPPRGACAVGTPGMRQRHKRFLQAPVALAHDLFDPIITALIAMLVTKPLPVAFGRMALLGRRIRVGPKDRVNGIQKRPELGLGPRSLRPVATLRRKRQALVDCLAIHSEEPRRRAPAAALDHHAPPHRFVTVHALHPVAASRDRQDSDHRCGWSLDRHAPLTNGASVAHYWGAAYTEVKHLGDGIMASFADPAAAVRSACEIQLRIASFKKDYTGSLFLRIGLHLGEPGEPVRENNDLFGAMVQLAARICNDAAVDAVVISGS